MRNRVSFGLRRPRLLALWSLSSAYFLVVGGGVFIALALMAHRVVSYPFFNIWSSWADFKCLWRCLGSRVAAFAVEEGASIIIFAFLFFTLLRAMLKTVGRLKETSTFAQQLITMASARRSWGIDYFVFPFALPLALTAGWLRPKIFLSSSLGETLTQEELRTVLLHEACHQRRRDPLRNLVLSFFADLIFFLPVTDSLRQAIGLTRELRADFYSLNNGQNLTSLFASLNKIHNYRVSPDLGLSLYSPARFNDLERLRYLSEGRLKLSLSWRQIVASILGFVLGCFLTLSPYGEIGKKVILEHKSSCSFHSLSEEEPKP